MKFILIILISFICSPGFAQVTGRNYRVQKKVICSHGAVVSAHTLASEAGLKMLQLGGNAFDAAVATQLALAVVYPGAGNLGGGGFLVAHTADGKNIALDYRESAPRKASKDMYLDQKGNPIEGLTMEGPLASGVPGSVAGFFATMKYARLPIKVLIEPAIMLAEKGFALTAAQAADFNESKETFLRVNKNRTAFVKSLPWKKGDILVQTDLANTLKRIRIKGLAGFYEGVTASMIVREMRRGPGIISLADLKNYSVKERIPVQFDYNGHQIVTMPLPSSGGIILEQLLKVFENRKIRDSVFQSPAAVQLIVEAERRAFADRAEFLGDPDFVKVPVTQLVDDKYLRDRMKDFTPGKAGNSNDVKAGSIHESDETTHLSVVDAEGNAVSVTTTLNDHFGSKRVVTGAGFILNNEMDDFSIKPGVPNMYGAVGNEKNAIAPGKRMLSSMTPTIVLKNNQPYIIVGTPGGTTIPTSVFQSIINVLDYDMAAESSVNAPKFHHQWLPDVVYVEKDFSITVRKQLSDMGYYISERGPIGRTEMIIVKTLTPARFETNGDMKALVKPILEITAAADKRGDDDARGY